MPTTLWTVSDAVELALHSKSFFFQLQSYADEALLEQLLYRAIMLREGNVYAGMGSLDILLLMRHMCRINPGTFGGRYLVDSGARRRFVELITEQPCLFDRSIEFCQLLFKAFCGCGEVRIDAKLTTGRFQHIMNHLITDQLEQFRGLLSSLFQCNRHGAISMCFHLVMFASLIRGEMDSDAVRWVHEFLTEHADIVAEPIAKYFAKLKEETLPSGFLTRLEDTPAKNKIVGFLSASAKFVSQCSQEMGTKMICDILDYYKDKELWVRYWKLSESGLSLSQRYEHMRNSGNLSLKFMKAACRSMSHSFNYFLRYSYLRSRFSSEPSEEVVQRCQEICPCLLFSAPIKNAALPNRKGLDNFSRLPSELIIGILSLVDPLTQLYSLPLVCKSWKLLNGSVLKTSAFMHKFFLHDLKCLSVSELAEELPWRHLFKGSVRDALDYFGTVISYNYKRISSGSYFRALLEYWDSYKFEALRWSEYLDKYVELTNASRTLLVFKKLPGLSNAQFMQMALDLVKTKSIMPVLPRSFNIFSDPSSLSPLVCDEETFARLICSHYQNFRTPCANLIAQQISLHHSFVNSLYSKSKPFYKVAEINVDLPIPLTILTSHIDIIEAVMRHVSREAERDASLLLIRLLICNVHNDMFMEKMVEALKRIKRTYLPYYPILYMLEFHAQFTEAQFSFLLDTFLTSGILKREHIPQLPLFYIFDYTRNI